MCEHPQSPSLLCKRAISLYLVYILAQGPLFYHRDHTRHRKDLTALTRSICHRLNKCHTSRHQILVEKQIQGHLRLPPRWVPPCQGWCPRYATHPQQCSIRASHPDRPSMLLRKWAAPQKAPDSLSQATCAQQGPVSVCYLAGSTHQQGQVQGC